QHASDRPRAPRTLREFALGWSSHLESGRTLHRPQWAVNALEIEWSKFLTRKSSAQPVRALTGKFVSGVIPPSPLLGAPRSIEFPVEERHTMRDRQGPRDSGEARVEFLDMCAHRVRVVGKPC